VFIKTTQCRTKVTRTSCVVNTQCTINVTQKFRFLLCNCSILHLKWMSFWKFL